MLRIIGEALLKVFTGLLTLAFLTMMIAFPLGFVAGLGWTAYSMVKDPALGKQTLLGLGSIGGVLLIAGLVIMAIGWIIEVIAKRFTIKQRLGFYSNIKWITGLAIFFYVPWRGTADFDEESRFLGYSFLYAPLSKNNYDTSLDLERAFYTVAIWLFLLYWFKVSLFGKKAVDLMLEGKFNPDEESQPEVAQ